MGDQPRVLVVGCGIIGLSSALLLQAKGYRVDIWAENLPPYTTSNKAAAYWYPYHIEPMSKVRVWAKKAFDYYEQVLMKDPGSGVMPCTCIRRFVDNGGEFEIGPEHVRNFQKVIKKEGPYGGYYQLDTFVINVDIAMNSLFNRFVLNGGRVIRKRVNSFEECFAQFDIVVNCTGLGARELANDPSVFAARGQTVIIRSHKNLQAVLHDSVGPNKLSYIVPRQFDVVLGGTFQEGNESLLISEKDTIEILQRCAGLSLDQIRGVIDSSKKGTSKKDERDIEIITEKVGLRPCRPTVRLEIEQRPNKKHIVHNYGHGGGGWSVAWGCADEVTQLVGQLLPTKSKL